MKGFHHTPAGIQVCDLHCLNTFFYSLHTFGVYLPGHYTAPIWRSSPLESASRRLERPWCEGLAEAVFSSAVSTRHSAWSRVLIVVGVLGRVLHMFKMTARIGAVAAVLMSYQRDLT
jgi:hypothetical protein